ncbi:RICIN domain-containing protein [Homoserinibacter sp. YIM 151385]|uniref:RICIN domain-containing protein n=1 Tax=Homoserinibacter sp. YIM 151385 TaxID=2985506 RepID=UPI0022F0064C|nr:RICIN domain-containing protein [Homoserinibacter sp. YIM 151385]WBU39146.1 RICIN domain-containing protein [Homoserinibacter sp. YIM 151385]
MSLRTRIAAILGIVLFVFLAGTGSAWALWATSATTGGTVRVANLQDACQNVTALVNASFEEPVVPNTYYNVANGNMPGWRSVDDTGAVAPIEVWKGTTEGKEPPVGNQFVELNANAPGTLFQSIATTPGQVLQWSLLHRARQGTDTMELFIGAVGTPQAADSQGQFKTSTAAWVRYSGAYVVPAGQTMTQLAFKAVATGSGDRTIGNLLDDVSFGSGPCLEIDSAAANITNPGGAYRVGDVVEYTETVTNEGSSPGLWSTYAFPLPAGVELVSSSISINGTSRTAAADSDPVDYASGSRTLTARLGAGATSSQGGSIAQGTTIVLRYRATIQASAAERTVPHAPSVEYVNDLAPNWGRTAVSPGAPISVGPAADLAVGVTANPAAVNRTSTATPVTWTIRLANNGPSATTGPVVSVTLPSGVTGSGIPSGTGFICTAFASNVSNCTYQGTLASGQAQTVSVTRNVPANPTMGASYSVGAAIASSATHDHVTSNNSASGATTVVDTQAPTAPGNVTAGPATNSTNGTQARIAWSASSDNVGVTGYRVYRDGVLAASTSSLSATVSGLTAGSTYTWTVRAVDAAGNISTASTAVSATQFNQSQYYSIQNLNSGLCVQTPYTNAVGILQQVACATAMGNQRWRFVATNDGWYTVRTSNAMGGWMIQPQTSTVPDTNNGAQAIYRDVTDAPEWAEFRPVAEADRGTWTFQIRSSGKCLDVPNASTATGVQLQQYECNTTWAQSFRLTPVN